MLVLRCQRRAGAAARGRLELRDPRHHARATKSTISGDVTARPRCGSSVISVSPRSTSTGAVGDVSPAGHGDRAARELGTALATAVRSGWDRAEPVRRPALARLPDGDAADAGALAAQLPLARLPHWATLPIGRVFPRDATLTAVSVATARGWPSRASCRRAGAGDQGGGQGRFRHTGVAGLTNDYLGYFLTPRDAGDPALRQLRQPVRSAHRDLPRASGRRPRAHARTRRSSRRARQVACDADAAGR
jgi:hypothetical protein